MSEPAPANSQKEVAPQSGLILSSPDHAAPEVFYPHTSPPLQKQPYAAPVPQDHNIQASPYGNGASAASPPYASPPKQAEPYVVPVADTADSNASPPPKQEAPYVAAASAPDRSGRVCGLRTTTFWLLIALAAVVVIAAVGGGVGGSIAVNNARSSNQNQNPSATGAPSVTASSPAALPSASAVTLDCPQIDGGTRNITAEGKSYFFKTACSVDINESNIITVVAYYLDDCLRACAAYNHNSGSSGQSCYAVEFNKDLTFELQNNFGNCWLKDTSGPMVTNSNYGNNTYVLAVLQS